MLSTLTALALVAAAFVIPATVVTIIVGPFAPFIVGFATRLNASATTKKVVNLILSVIVALVIATTMTDGSAVITLDTVWRFLTNLVVVYFLSSQSYDRVWKPALDINMKLFPERGIY